MRILLTGATGLIGRELGKALAARGDTLVCLVRDVSAARRRLPFPAVCHAWDHTRAGACRSLREVDAVVNLAGEPVADTRWTTARKALIRDSRVHGTRQLVRAVPEHGASVAAFVQGSAIGFYGDRGDERLTAASTKGAGFLADVVAGLGGRTAAAGRARPKCVCRSCARASCWRARAERWPRCCRCSGSRRPVGSARPAVDELDPPRRHRWSVPARA